VTHIPSMQSLRVFRKAAETLSFSQSAEELCLTQSAVSHQIKQLEEQLRTSLFVRHRRGILLSGTGQRFLKAITPILNELEATVASLRNGFECGQIVIRVESTLLVSRLLPNLSELLDLMPDLRVHLEASDGAPRDLMEDRVIAVYLGQEIRETDVYCTAIADEECFAVCSPDLLAQHPVRSLGDLKHHRLLLVKKDANGSESDWRTWLPGEECELLTAASHAIFGTRALALSAALVGQGVTLCGSIAASPHLLSGALVQPLDRRVKCSDSYYFACPKILLGVPGVHLLRDWIVGKAAVPRQVLKRNACSEHAPSRTADRDAPRGEPHSFAQ
jgi:LysR family transcriptional regulator, glycine cleavage system transcriptional activator